MTMTDYKAAPHEATRNACRLCAPLGASVAFAGIEGCLPYLHGGQGCATYIRRYMISHFREPMDIASSSFGEEATVFGGKANLFKGLKNVIAQYNPQVIGIASTCLSETIGEDVPALIKEFSQTEDNLNTALVFASTPSYVGSHYDGYHRAVYATAKTLANDEGKHDGINLLPNMISAADIRYLKDICADFGLSATVLPDYSETLDGGSWAEYQRLPQGGTPLPKIRGMGGAQATIEFTRFIEKELSAAAYLYDSFGVPAYRTGMPVGISATDEFMKILCEYSGRDIPERYVKEHGRLLDSYADAHKYLFGKKALVYGDADFIMGIGSFLAEIGMIPVLCAAGKERNLAETAGKSLERAIDSSIYEHVDFVDIENISRELHPDMLIGSSKGYRLSRLLGIPLVRLGFPVHDRIGAVRLRCIGYGGTQELFDRIVNALLENRQEESEVGYSYM
jgi:nitrogenase molybdenum-iron protein NifN